LAAMRASFDAMVRRLAAVVPDLGHRTAGDATALSARRGDERASEGRDALGLPQPTGGRKEGISTPKGRSRRSWSGSATSCTS
jgi:hypothetical protein